MLLCRWRHLSADENVRHDGGGGGGGDAISYLSEDVADGKRRWEGKCGSGEGGRGDARGGREGSCSRERERVGKGSYGWDGEVTWQRETEWGY